MQVIRNGCIKEKTAVALGNFDGLHKAHTAIIESCCKYAEENGLKSGVLLFSEHPANVIGGDIKLITDNRSKLEILDSMGVDFAYIIDFDKDIMKLSPEEFICMLKDTMNPVAVFTGYDYRFGYKAAGDTNLLRRLGDDMGFCVRVTDEIDYNGIPIKSTQIRELLEKGNVKMAAELLGRDFFVRGAVVSGFQNGSKIGFPTANIKYDKSIFLPKNGVYAGYTAVGGKCYKSVINVGNNPTFNADRVTVESHIIDFNRDIYGEEARVYFKDRIRDEKKFNSIDKLKAQIQKDVHSAERID